MAALTTEIGREYGMSSAHSLFNMGLTLGHMLSPILLGIVYDSWLGVDWVFPIIGIVGYIGLVAFYLIVRSDKSNYGRRVAV
jgi:dipeptide/tripeptide permease